jgi:hypothetical protein
VAQVDAPGTIHFSSGYSSMDIHSCQMSGRVDVGTGVVHHRDEHRRQPVHIA